MKLQKNPLMARIEGAFVEVSKGVEVDEVSPTNLKIAGIAILFADRLTDLREIRSDQDLVPTMGLSTTAVIVELCCKTQNN